MCASSQTLDDTVTANSTPQHTATHTISKSTSHTPLLIDSTIISNKQPDDIQQQQQQSFHHNASDNDISTGGNSPSSNTAESLDDTSHTRRPTKRRKPTELGIHERWTCPHIGCTKVYRKTSTNSIKAHIEACLHKSNAMAQALLTNQHRPYALYNTPYSNVALPQHMIQPGNTISHQQSSLYQYTYLPQPYQLPPQYYAHVQSLPTNNTQPAQQSATQPLYIQSAGTAVPPQQWQNIQPSPYAAAIPQSTPPHAYYTQQPQYNPAQQYNTLAAQYTRSMQQLPQQTIKNESIRK